MPCRDLLQNLCPKSCSKTYFHTTPRRIKKKATHLLLPKDFLVFHTKPSHNQHVLKKKLHVFKCSCQADSRASGGEKPAGRQAGVRE